MVRETLTLEGHLIDSDILRARLRPRGRGGRRVRGPGVPRRAHQRRAVLRADRGARARRAGARPHPRGAALPGRARRDSEVADCRFAPAERGRDPARRLLLDHELRDARADRRALGGGRRPEDGLRRSCCATACRTASSSGRCARASRWRCAVPGSACGRSSAAATTRVFGFMSNDVSAEVNKAIVIRARGARDEARARGGRADRGRAGPGGGPLGRRHGARRGSSGTAGST